MKTVDRYKNPLIGRWKKVSITRCVHGKRGQKALEEPYKDIA